MKQHFYTPAPEDVGAFTLLTPKLHKGQVHRGWVHLLQQQTSWHRLALVPKEGKCHQRSFPTQGIGIAQKSLLEKILLSPEITKGSSHVNDTDPGAGTSRKRLCKLRKSTTKIRKSTEKEHGENASEVRVHLVSCALLLFIPRATLKGGWGWAIRSSGPKSGARWWVPTKHFKDTVKIHRF